LPYVVAESLSSRKNATHLESYVSTHLCSKLVYNLKIFLCSDSYVEPSKSNKAPIMKNKIFTLFFACASLLAFGQHATLLKNYNPKVQELKHYLNHTKDSLILECETPILKVDIFNEDYEKLIPVEANSTQITLNDIPEGKFVVEVRLVDKIVVMHIIIHQDFNDALLSAALYKNSTIAEGQGMMLDEGLNVVTSVPKMSLETMLNQRPSNSRTKKNEKLYWTIIRVNNEIGSSKTMRLIDKKDADRMILKNKLEHQSAIGKKNELIVWEVYNTSKFMEQQLVNPDFVYTLSSEYFNTTPYFTSDQSLQNM